MQVHGNVCYLTDEELFLLDGFERGPPPPGGLASNPYEADGAYRRQDIVVRLPPKHEGAGNLEAGDTEHGSSHESKALGGDDGASLEAVAYVKCDLTWIRAPSDGYLEACHKNVNAFWPALEASIEVRDGRGRLVSW